MSVYKLLWDLGLVLRNTARACQLDATLGL